MAKGLLLSLFLVALWILAQLVVVHAFRPVRVFSAMTWLFAPTLPAFVVLYVLAPPGLFVLPEGLVRESMALGLLNGLFVHLLLYCTWVEAFFCIDRPVTLRILVEFAKAPRGRLTLPQIRDVYSLEQMIAQRLHSMRLNGYVEERGGRYVLTPKGRALARGIRRLRRLLGVSYYLDAPGAGGPARSGAAQSP